MTPPEPRPSRLLPLSPLRADCSQCLGLCCVGLAFSKATDFPFDKESGEPCRNLDTEDRCSIHERLRPAGFKGCTVFDCLGAGQQTSQVVLGGRGWREEPDRATEIFAVFQLMRRLHELLFYLTEAVSLATDPSTAETAAVLLSEVDQVTNSGVDDVLACDVAALRARTDVVLAEVSRQARAGAAAASGPESAGKGSAGKGSAGKGSAGKGTAGKGTAGKRSGSVRAVAHRVRAGVDLCGADLRGADLRGADLRGALLIAVDLRGADLRRADLIGADLRDADVGGADLETALFLTQQQINATNGTALTRIPSGRNRPDHWRR